MQIESRRSFFRGAAAALLTASCVWLVGCGIGGEPLDLPVGNATFAADTSDHSEKSVRTVVSQARRSGPGARIVIDYPGEGALFPPDIAAPTFVFHDPGQGVEQWLVHVSLDGGNMHLYVVSDADPSRRKPVIDERCVTGTNVYTPTDYQKAARTWRPDNETWQIMKQHSVGQDLELTVYGMDDRSRVLSEGGVRFQTSSDPVGAPIFYRDVPLMPAENTEGVVNPLQKGALSLIAWRLRDISQRSSPIVMEGLPTCGNCHSFSSDGRTLGMDMDGPTGDKGAFAVTEVGETTIFENDDVFSWNSYDPDKTTFGLFSRVSPDGRYVISSVDEEVFVSNYLDYLFLQTFYPTRGILAIHDRETGKITALPGADDPAYVHCNAVWTPDGETLAFLRAPAVEARPPDMDMPTHANDPRETRILFGIYTMPFDGGRGGVPKPLIGASNNGKSNSFPKYSPDGKWLVYVQAGNGLLMRPDSRLFIVPAEGGEPREMRCNTARMNSWHSWSPNSRWLVFSSKSRRPYTEMFLTHVDADGNDSPAILIEDATADNRAVNLPEFANIAGNGIGKILTPAVDYRRLLDRGSALRDDGDLEAAEAELRASLELRPDFTETRQVFAGVLAEQGKTEEAEIAYRQALEREPDNASALNNLGFLLDAQGDTDGAVGCYRRALEVAPDNAFAHLNLGAVMARLKRDDEAAAHLRQALESEPDNLSAHRILGLVLDRGGHTGAAIPHLEMVIAADPAQHRIRRNLAFAYLRFGDDEKAVDHFRVLAQGFPKDASVRRNLGFSLDRSGHHTEAVVHLEAAVSLAPKQDSAWVNWGVALANLGEYDAAGAKFRKALELNPANTSAQNNLEKMARER